MWTKKAAIARMEKNERLTELLEAEPRLRPILHAARQQRNAPGYQWARTYTRLKQRASQVVGWSVTHPLLGTAAAYEVVLRAIADLLPPDEVELANQPVPATRDVEWERGMWQIDDEEGER